MNTSPTVVPAASDRLATCVQRYRFTRWVLALSMLIMGACGIIYEYVLGVLGNNLMGSSHEQIFVIIGIMMFAMGLAAMFQRRIERDTLDWFLIIELALGLLGGISASVIFTTFVYTAIYQVVMYSFAFLVGGLIGLEIPLLIRINADYARNLRVNLSDILCMDYVGSLLGALLFAYFLLTRFSIGRISFVLGTVNTVLAIFGLIYFWPLVRRRWWLLTASTIILTVMGLGLLRVDDWIATLEQRCFADPIVYSETSQYQHLVLTQRNDRLNLYLNGHLQFSSSDEMIYHEMLAHLPLSLAPQRERVLILGGGDGLALREVLKYPDVQQVTLVDLDPAMIRLASEHPELIRLNQAAFHDARVHASIANAASKGDTIRVARPTKLAASYIDQQRYELAKVEIFTIDADQFLMHAEGQYDVAILDFPDPRSVELAKLYSVDFYRQLARHLAPDAILSVQSTSPHRAPQVFSCIGRTLEAAGYQSLPYQGYLPSFGDWGWHLAWRNHPAPAEMRKHVEHLRLDVNTQYLTREVAAASLAFGRHQLPQAKTVRPNTKLRPVIIDYYRQGYR